ncbi:MAG TPA: nucleoside-diphosphate kinase [Polyangia bacterium]|nr:nucleoside-diphosphate kinase [Polyangia bacterium]
MSELTLCVIKPNAVRKNRIGTIVKSLEDEGLRVAAVRMTVLRRAQVEDFYAEHKGKDFFEGLVRFMTSGPICAFVLEGEDAVGRARKVMGATNPADAAPGSIRATYGESITENAIHGSDSPNSAAREIGFYFRGFDIF